MAKKAKRNSRTRSERNAAEIGTRVRAWDIRGETRANPLADEYRSA